MGEAAEHGDAGGREGLFKGGKSSFETCPQDALKAWRSNKNAISERNLFYSESRMILFVVLFIHFSNGNFAIFLKKT